MSELETKKKANREAVARWRKKPENKQKNRKWARLAYRRKINGADLFTISKLA